MRINPIQVNIFQSKPQNTVSSPLRINNSVQADTVSFTGKAEKKISKEKMGKLVPKHKGIIYRKLQDAEGAVVKVPVLVDIVKSEPEEFEFKIDGRRIGYARLSYIPKKYCKDEIKDAYVDCYYKNYEHAPFLPIATLFRLGFYPMFPSCMLLFSLLEAQTIPVSARLRCGPSRAVDRLL